MLCALTPTKSDWLTMKLTIFKCLKRAVGILTAVQRKVLTDTRVMVVEKEICG